MAMWKKLILIRKCTRTSTLKSYDFSTAYLQMSSSYIFFPCYSRRFDKKKILKYCQAKRVLIYLIE